MAKFLTHDAIASGLLNRGYNSADSLAGSATIWREALQNRTPVLELLLQRMDGDFKNTHVRMRKCWKTPDLVACLKRSCLAMRDVKL